MIKNIKYFFSFLSVLSSLLCFAQQNKVDSMWSVLKMRNTNPSGEYTPTIKGKNFGTKSDTIWIKTLNNLAWELRYTNPDTAIILCTQASDFCFTNYADEKTTSAMRKTIVECLAKSYNILGALNYIKGNFPLALDYYFKALKIRESLDDKKGISITLGNIGGVYATQGNYTKALECFFRTLKMDEEFQDKKVMDNHLSRVGIVYMQLGDYAKALDYYFKALKIAEELKDQNKIANALGNIGLVYREKGDLTKALDYYFKALKINEETGDKNGIALRLSNIGVAYNLLGEANHNPLEKEKFFNKALDSYHSALKITEEFGDRAGIAINLGNIGSLYIMTKKFKQAEESLQKALAISTEINAIRVIKDHQQMLSELYEQTGQPAKALEHYKNYIATKDSIFNEENTKKTVRSEMNFDFEKKQAIEKAEQEKQNAITQQEKHKQKVILILVSCFLVLVVVFASFMFNRWRITQRQKLTIEKQQEKILDSITYAQLIQQSILIEESEIKKYLPDSFIYYQPKDVVSGDFYWFSEIGGSRNSAEQGTNNTSRLQTSDAKLIIAAIDCTGHGVPGAFMSMIGNTLLNQIVNEKQITSPSEILRLLNQGVTEALHQQKDGALSDDGMDIALCCIDYKNNQLEFAGAQNPMYVLSDNKLTEIKGDIYSIGGNEFITKKENSMNLEYTNHVIPIKKGMSIYLFSDGYSDQFGGKDRKKFGTQKLKELLLKNQHLSMQKQKEFIADSHSDWKGSTSQIDDILVMGLVL